LVQHSLPVDEEGINVEAGRASAPNAKFAYVTAACQFPCCVPLSEQRRQSLLAWALERKSYIIEDDWDFNATFNGQLPRPPLAARNAEQVIFIHSLNRLLFPALRIAALVVPHHLVERFVDARRAIDGFPNVPNQMALAEFMNQGFMSAHLRRCRIAYERRRLCLHRLVEEQLGDWFKAETDRDGLQTIVRTGQLNSAAIAAAAQRERIVCRSMSEFAIQQKTTPANLILGFGAFAPESLEMAAGRLRELMRDAL
jgi:GntR family transcriptional regulator/MocR family aminotransferase